MTTALPGDHGQQQEQRAVRQAGDQRADGVADGESVGRPGQHQPGDQHRHGAEDGDHGRRRPPAWCTTMRVPAQRLGQQVDDRPVVDLRADRRRCRRSARAAAPAWRARRRRAGCPTVMSSSVGPASSADEDAQHEQHDRAAPAAGSARRRPSRLRAVSRATVAFIAPPGRRRRSPATRRPVSPRRAGCRAGWRAAGSDADERREVGGLHVQGAGAVPAAGRRCPRAATSVPCAAISCTPDVLGSAMIAEASARSSLERIVYWCGRSVISRRISRKSPDAACRPATITSMLPAICSTSSRMCELNSTVRPCVAHRAAAAPSGAAAGAGPSR